MRRVCLEEKSEEEEVLADRGEDPEGDHRRRRSRKFDGAKSENGQGAGGSRLEAAV